MARAPSRPDLQHSHSGGGGAGSAMSNASRGAAVCVSGRGECGRTECTVPTPAPALAIWPLVSASTSASWSTTSPRLVFTSVAVGFMRANAAASNRLAVSGVNGQCTDTTSDCSSSTSRGTHSAPTRAAASAFSRGAAYRMRQPKPLQPSETGQGGGKAALGQRSCARVEHTARGIGVCGRCGASIITSAYAPQQSRWLRDQRGRRWTR